MHIGVDHRQLELEGKEGTKTLMALATSQVVLWSSLSQGEWKGASGKGLCGQMGHGAISRKAVC